MAPPEPSAPGPFVVQLGEVAVSIDSDDPAVRGAIVELLRHCQLGFETGTRLCRTVALTTRITVDGNHLLTRDGEEQFRGRSVTALIEHLLYEVTVGLGTGARSSLVLHGAGLAWENRGVILCGESGAGKSTLALRLLEAGFDFLSDELVVVSEGETVMRGFPRPIVLKDPATHSMAWAGADTTPVGLRGLNGVVYLDPERLRAGSVRRQVTPSLLVFPRHTAGSQLSFRKLTAAEAVFRLMHRVVNAANLPERGFADVTRLGQQLPAYAVSYPDASEAAAWLGRTLAEKARDGVR